MNKAYFIAPILLLIVFSGFYGVHRGGYQEREAEKAAIAAAELKAKNEADLEARRAAMADAIAAQEQRKKEREEKAAREAAEREIRQTAIDARDRAFREQERSARQIERVKKEIEAEQAALEKLAAAQKEAAAEKAFLQDFVVKAQANVQALQTLLTKLNTPPPAPVPAAR
jgi:hypothetical protein